METTDEPKPGSKSGLNAPASSARPKLGLSGAELFGAGTAYALSYAVIYVDKTGLVSLIGALGTSTALILRRIAPEAAFFRRSWSQANDGTWQHKYERMKEERDECLEDRKRQYELISRMQRDIEDLQRTVKWLRDERDDSNRCYAELKTKYTELEKKYDKGSNTVEHEILVNNEVVKGDDPPPTR